MLEEVLVVGGVGVDGGAAVDEACDCELMEEVVVVGGVGGVAVDEAWELLEVLGLVFPRDEYSSGNSVKSQCRSLKKRFWCWL